MRNNTLTILWTAILSCLAACSSVPVRPVVILETSQGHIEIEVYTDKAPISAKDFLLYVDKGYYEGEGFYRTVLPDSEDPLQTGTSLIQGGRLDGEPLTETIAHELTKDTGLSNTEGVLSLARNEPGTGSAAYFFINIGDNSFLDYGSTRYSDQEGFATFAKVISGMDVVRQIQSLEAKGEAESDVMAGQMLTHPVKIIKAYRK